MPNTRIVEDKLYDIEFKHVLDDDIICCEKIKGKDVFRYKNSLNDRGYEVIGIRELMC